MLFNAATINRIRHELVSFRGLVASNKVLPKQLRSNADYEQRMKRKAAVLVPLANVDGEASILFTVRAKHLNTHAAQVAFPGGHLDQGETEEQAALRELKEEMGLSAEALGMWKAARAYTGTMVTPILGILPDISKLDVQRSALVQPLEVSGTFHLPISHLMDPQNRRIEELQSFRTSRFSGGPEPVWGLTAFFLEGILRDVLAPAFDVVYAPTPLMEKVLEESSST